MARKGKYDEDVINELADSVYFRKPQAPPPPITALEEPPAARNQAPQESLPAAPPQADPTPSVRSYERTDGRRGLRRYAFEFYEDQLADLKQFSLQDQLKGGRGNMSEMVRAAMDTYINERKGRGG